MFKVITFTPLCHLVFLSPPPPVLLRPVILPPLTECGSKWTEWKKMEFQGRREGRERESSPWMLCLEFICKPRAVFRKDYHNKVISGNVRLWRLFQRVHGVPRVRARTCVCVVKFAPLLYLEMNWSLSFESVFVLRPLCEKKEQHPFPVLFGIIIAEQWSALQASHH